MATTGPWINRAIAAVLMLTVAGVGIFALTTLFAADDESEREVSETETETEVAGAERPFPGREIEIDDNEFPLTVSCVRASGSEPVFVAIVTNRAASATDYLVAAELSNADGESTSALVEFNDLQSNEKRELVLVPAADIGAVNSCAITAVQGDRRVLLSR